jgi:hypothetical protein
VTSNRFARVLRRADIPDRCVKRFHKKYGAPNENGCVIWNGTLNDRGYGQLLLAKGKGMKYAHRIAWVLANGDLPSDKMVLHKCDVPRCINVDHLFLGSAMDNSRDMVAKGRHAWRQGTRWQKLNATDGERICDLRAHGCTQQQIADWFGVSRPLISLILNGHINHSAHLVAI